jgi:uncharacterized membrane protein
VLLSATVLGFSVYLLLWLFLVYSFLGVLIEGFFCLVTDGVLQLRLGLLYLPLRPLYGIGGVASTVLCYRFLPEPLVVFGLGMLVCSVVEFLDHWLFEKAFGTVSWDYSDKPLHLQGRICLQYSVCWGLLALAALYGLDQVLGGSLAPAAGPLARDLLTACLVLVLLSLVLTVVALAGVRRRIDLRRAQAHGEEASSGRARDSLVERLVPDRVIIHSFPHLSLTSELERATAGVPGRRSAVRG